MPEIEVFVLSMTAADFTHGLHALTGQLAPILAELEAPGHVAISSSRQ